MPSMILKSNGYKNISFDLREGRSIKKSHFPSGEDEILPCRSLQKNLFKLDRKYETLQTRIMFRLSNSQIKLVCLVLHFLL